MNAWPPSGCSIGSRSSWRLRSWLCGLAAAVAAGDAKECTGKFASGRVSELVDSSAVFRGFSTCDDTRGSRVAHAARSQSGRMISSRNTSGVQATRCCSVPGSLVPRLRTPPAAALPSLPGAWHLHAEYAPTIRERGVDAHGPSHPARS